MPDDDWALGQNEVDVRNEARMARHGRTLMPALDALERARRAQELHERRIDVQLRFEAETPDKERDRSS